MRTAPRNPGTSRGTPDGFTLIELLVVIAILALLVAILVPSLRRAKDLANRVLCLTNQRPIVVVNHLYASESNGWYIQNPLGNVSGRQMYSEPWGNAATIYESYLGGHEAAKRNFYPCDRADENLGGWWESTWERKTGVTLLVGYCTTFGQACIPQWSPMRAGEPGKNPADLLVVGDITENSSYWYGFWPHGYFANHVDAAAFPVGGNNLFDDGHGEWIDWDDMEERPGTAPWNKFW